MASSGNTTCVGIRVAALLVALTLGAHGCGSSIGTISGKVIYRNEPLDAGTVTFLNQSSAIRSPIAADGSYEIRDMPVGPVTITVTTPAHFRTPGGPSVMGKMDPKQMGSGDKAKSDAEKSGRGTAIPKNYSSAEHSPLTYTVKSGSQTHNILLE